MNVLLQVFQTKIDSEKKCWKILEFAWSVDHVISYSLFLEKKGSFKSFLEQSRSAFVPSIIVYDIDSYDINVTVHGDFTVKRKV